MCPGGEYFQKDLVGVCGPLSKTLSLFVTKICAFLRYSVFDLATNSILCLWPLLWSSCPKNKLWRAFVDDLLYKGEKVASSEKLINTRLERKSHTLFMTKLAKENHTLWGRTYLYSHIWEYLIPPPPPPPSFWGQVCMYEWTKAARAHVILITWF